MSFDKTFSTPLILPFFCLLLGTPTIALSATGTGIDIHDETWSASFPGNVPGPLYGAETRQVDRTQTTISIVYDPIKSGPVGSIYSETILGSGTNVFGEPAKAEAYSDGSGTYWVNVNAANSPPLSSGNAKYGYANATNTTYFTKIADTAQFNIDITGGILSLFDGGGGSDPLLSFVTAQVHVINPGSNPLPAENDPAQGFGQREYYYYAKLDGRGGDPSWIAETFDYQSTFPVAVNYIEEKLQGSNYTSTATLQIPQHTIPIDLSSVCLGCDAGVSVILTARAFNPGAETRAWAYLRDPSSISGNDPGLGGAKASYSGINLIPSPTTVVPLPSAFWLFAMGASAVAGFSRSRAKQD